MKKQFLALIFIIIFILNFPLKTFAQDSQPTTLPPVVINEIAAFEDSGFEWIEILNISESPIDLTDFSFYENTTKHKLKPVINDLILEPNEFAIIAQDTDKFLQKNTNFTTTLIDSSWESLKEDGEEIGIVDSSENFLEKFTYFSSPDTSLERKDARIMDYTAQNWLIHPLSATPGLINSCINQVINQPEDQIQENPITDPQTEAQPEPVASENPPTPQQTPANPKVYVNEISLRDSETDWVEILVLNEDNTPADLSSYSIWTDSMLFKIPENTMVNSGAYYTASLENTDGISATTEQVILKNKDGKMIDGMCVTNGTVAQSEIQEMQEILDNEMWISKEPTSCVDISTIEKDWSVGRKIPFLDSDSKDDFAIFRHSTKNTPNEFKNLNPIPIINVQSGNLTDRAPLTLNIDGSASHDPENDEMRFKWDFGDGISEETQNPRSHTYTIPGNYTLTLAVEDSFEGRATTSLQITVMPEILPQQAVISQPAQPILPAQTLIVSNTEPAKTASQSTEKTEIKTTSTKTTTKAIKTKTTKSTKKTAEAKTATKKASAKEEKINKNGDLSKKLMITEIMPNPEGSDTDEEWVEIFNPENKAINLGNWSLDDEEGGSKPYIFPDTTVIGPKKFLVLSREETKLSLNNTKDSIRLFDFLKNLVIEIAYAKSPEGKSYIKTDDSFEWTADITPGAKNPKYRLIVGQIEDINSEAKTILIAGADGLKNISFSEDLLHPLIAPMTLPKGGSASLQIEEEPDGKLSLHKIQSVVPPAEEKENETSYMPWVIGAIISISLIGNLSLAGMTLWPKLKEKLR